MDVFKKVLQKSCETSSMKALPRIIKAKGHCQHLLWTFGLLVGLSVAGYQLTEMIVGYLSYSTIIHLEEQKGLPPFPDVTVCHQDREWTLRSLKDEKSFAEYQEQVAREMTKYPPDSAEYILLNENLYSYDSSYLQNNPKLEFLKEELKNKFIMNCYVLYDWVSKPCKDLNSSFLETHIFLDPIFGYCITYQTKVKYKIRELSIILYLDDQGKRLEPQHFDLGRYEAHRREIAASITIHPQGSFPDMLTTRSFVPAGVDVGFMLSAMLRSILGEPYGDCISDEEYKTLRELGKPGYSSTRHMLECFRMCGKEAVMEQCGCLAVYYPMIKYDPKDTLGCGKLESDNMSITLERLKCAERVLKELQVNMESECHCTDLCEKFTYDYTTESIRWPDDVFHLSFYEQYIRNSSFASKFQAYEPIYQEWKSSNASGAQRNVTEWDLIYKNFALIRIENHQKEFLHYSETPLISLESLFGMVGGLLNLWAGITFITIIEIIDFMHQLFARKSEYQRSKKGTKQTDV